MKFKFTLKIIILLIFLAFSFLALFVNSNGLTFFQKGVYITSVDINSTAYEQGLRQGQIIQSINGLRITDMESYSNSITGKFLEGKLEKLNIQTKDSELILYTDKAPEITIIDLPRTNLVFGLDLSGGARALIKAEEKDLTNEEVQDLVQITRNRLNEFGLTDLKVVPIFDSDGNNYMLVEIAGATPNDLEQMIAQQGKFEAKIGEEIVFIGGERDIMSVGRSGQESYVKRAQQDSNGNYFSEFMFSVHLSQIAAERHAEITKSLDVNITSQGKYLSKKLDLYLDDKLVDSLLIGESLKGIPQPRISISGSGTGTTALEAEENARENMHKLQTILITGSLPFKLEIVKLDTISSVLGKDFLKSILIAGFLALLAVSILIFTLYRNLKVSLALLLTSFSEVFIILGIASFIGWNLDLLSIAGILATIGIGIDQQIIIIDEARNKKELSLKERLKRAFAILLGAYFTAFAALIPLWWAVAGLLKGFALTTLIGITVGILVTRPAFTDLIKFIEG